MTLRLRTERLADLTPAELTRVAVGNLSGLEECKVPTLDCLPDTLLDCMTGNYTGRLR